MSLIRLDPIRWPYSLGQLRADEPARSFSAAPGDAELAEYGVFRVTPLEQPAYDPATHRVVEVQPLEQDGQWLQQWELVPLTEAEQEAYYRQTHPPRWLEFGQAVQADPAINALLAVALQQAPALAMALSVGLGKAADGDSRVFLAAWGTARGLGLVSAELVASTQAAAEAHDLPAEFIAGLARAQQEWDWPESPERGDEWSGPDGSRWRWDQPRAADGTYLADDPATPEQESALQWLPVEVLS
ncbi:MAG: hypothetical protein RLZZ32_825 [Cyanobacteriota bacterium]|jgi:hypothetical protein